MSAVELNRESWLAVGAPVGAAGVRALEAALDGGVAAATGFAFATIDPEAGAGVGVAGGAAFAALEGDDAVGGVFEDVGGEESLGGGDHVFRLARGEGADPAEGAQAEQETDLRLVDIAHAGQDFLAKEDVAQLFVHIGQEAGDGVVGVKGFAQDVAVRGGNSAVAGERGCGVHFGDGDADCKSDEVGGFEVDADVAAGDEPAFAGAVDVPAAAHQHVGDENGRGFDGGGLPFLGMRAGEVDQKPLAAGFYFGDDLAGEGLVIVGTGDQGVGGFEAGNGLAGEGTAESTGGSIDGIAFRHCAFPLRVGCGDIVRPILC